MADLSSLPTDPAALKLMVESLTAQVSRLERKLHDVHALDANVLRRVNTSMAQHVEALSAEADGLLQRIQSLETSFLDAKLVASQVSTVAAGAAFGWLGHKVVAQEPSAPFWLRVAPWLIGGTFALFNMVRISERRWEEQAARNAARKDHLEKQARVVEERIGIMVLLCRPPPPQAPPEHVAVSIPAASITQQDADNWRREAVPAGPDDHV